MEDLYSFSCRICRMNPMRMEWLLIEDENGVLEDIPFVVFSYCIMSPFCKPENSGPPPDGYTRCMNPVRSIQNFSWDEWNKYMELRKGKEES